MNEFGIDILGSQVAWKDYFDNADNHFSVEILEMLYAGDTCEI